jgi:diaminopimelate decarboxylase
VGATVGDALRSAARRFGTPLFVTDVPTLDAAAAELRAAFPDPWLRQYSVKANDVGAIVARLTDPAGPGGLGANVVSRGEWSIARRAGVPNERITLEGIGKTDADLRAAVRAAARGEPLRWVAVESVDEAAALAAHARSAGTVGFPQPLDALLRLNPEVAPETHPGLAVGAGTSKFGMTGTELGAAIEAGGGQRGRVRWRGIHLYVGSQLGAIDAWRDAVRRALALLAFLRGGLPDFDTLDVGGGFPVAPFGATGPDGTAAVPAPARFAIEMDRLLDGLPGDRRPARLATEPGRFLVARASWLVGRVLHVRERNGAPLAVVDAGMTELIRPALYGARHPIVALTSLGRPVEIHRDQADALRAGGRPTRVDGPICESTDTLGEHRLPPLRRGDLVAIADAGAYAAALGSTYNGRPRPPQVLLDADGRLSLGRRRGSLASLR